jgi:hypothetical protein
MNCSPPREIVVIKPLSPTVSRTDVNIGVQRATRKERCMKQLGGFQDVGHSRKSLHGRNNAISVPLYGSVIKVNESCHLAAAAEAVLSEFKKRCGNVGQRYVVAK